jgi:hypothetical protein
VADQEVGDTIAALDQAGAENRALARTTGEFFRTLLDSGFERHEAMSLTADWLNRVLYNVGDDD